VVTDEPAIEDLELVARFLATRSDDAFLRLYDRHTPALYRFAARLTGGPGVEADEVVQEAWVRGISRLESFGRRSSLRTWLCGIVLNCAREKWQTTGRERQALAIVARKPQQTAQEEPVISRALEVAIRALPAGYREILILHDVEGYTHEEIAMYFGIVEGTSKSQLHRARRALRDALATRGARHGG
jgi:RNA polymerase sigma-70 factor (ECF subfamily)